MRGTNGHVGSLLMFTPLVPIEARSNSRRKCSPPRKDGIPRKHTGVREGLRALASGHRISHLTVGTHVVAGCGNLGKKSSW